LVFLISEIKININISTVLSILLNVER
jgi:hypothetical protein